jgi:thiol-disulfide isomerase/thioredoxin
VISWKPPSGIVGGQIVLGLTLAIMLASCSKERTDGDDTTEIDSVTAISAGSKVSDLVLKGIDGRSVKFEELHQKIVLLSFLATWNSDSIEFVPVLNQLHSKFKIKVNVIGVMLDRGSVPALRSFMQEQQIDFPVYVNGDEIVNSFGGIRKLPTTYIVLRDGMIFKRFNGIQRKDKYEYWLIKLLVHRM